MENLKMDHILKIMEQFEKTSIDTLKYKNDGEEILLTKRKNGTSVQVNNNEVKPVNGTSEGQTQEPPVEEKAEASKPEEAQTEDHLVTIESPIVGTFYRSPAPGKSPYVQKGDKVKKGDVLCIIEAMKVMNKIESEYDGEIAEICHEDSETVEYGTCLIKIKPD